ncbi:hypothetical protein D3C78_869220 [compost metagenome]
MQPAEPARGHQKLQLQRGVVQNVQQCLTRLRILLLADLLLGHTTGIGSSDLAFAQQAAIGCDLGLGLVPFGLRDIQLHLADRVQFGQALVGLPGLLGGIHARLGLVQLGLRQAAVKLHQQLALAKGTTLHHRQALHLGADFSR